MDLVSIIVFCIIALLATNFLYGIFFLIAYRGVCNFYEWSFDEAIALFLPAEVGFFPLFGVSYYTATFLYEKCNWFFARLLVLVYLIILIIVMVVLSVLFDVI